MTRPVARLSDRTTGTCSHPSHLVPISVGGSITTASTDVLTNSPLGTARIGDTVTSDCGHTGKIITGSPQVEANRRKVARIGDKFEGDYSGEIITGATLTDKRVNSQP